jgi:hypothetical protein
MYYLQVSIVVKETLIILSKISNKVVQRLDIYPSPAVHKEGTPEYMAYVSVRVEILQAQWAFFYSSVSVKVLQVS